MKILIATGLYPPDIGGPATHTALLEKHLPAQGFTIDTIAFGRVRHYPKILRHLVYTLLLIVHARGASCIYALDPVSVGLPALIAAKITRKRLILRVAGDYAWEQGTLRYRVGSFLDAFVKEMKQQPFPVRVLGYIERVVARGAYVVVVPSEYLKGIVQQWGIEETKISVIYTAFTPITVTESKEVNRTFFGLSGTVIASAGRLVPWKGFRVLIEVIAELQSEIPDIQLVVVGDGPELSALVAHAKEHRVADRVVFTGRASKEGLTRAIAGADVFVLNTAYEGFSHQLLEVMALGVPIVTTRVGGNPELITDTKEGMLVSYDNKSQIRDAILHIVRNQGVRDAFCTHAKARVAQFTVERMVRESAALFTRMAPHKT